VPRPKYGASSAKDVEEDEEEKENEDEDEGEGAEEPVKEDVADASDEEESVKPVKAGRLDKFKHKANHEATSEEDN